jgi:hypothetical protein
MELCLDRRLSLKAIFLLKRKKTKGGLGLFALKSVTQRLSLA